MKFFIACFVIFLASANAQRNFTGPCPVVRTQPNFKLEEFMGDWYKQSGYPRKHGNEVCLVTYGNLKGNDLDFIVTQVKNKALEKVSTPVRYLGNAKFELKKYNHKTDFVSRGHSVLATDYVNYSIRYGCKNTKEGHEMFIAIVTRKPNPPDDVVKAAKDEISKQNLPLEPLTSLRSKDCKM